MVFSVGDWRHKYNNFGSRLDAMLQISLESGILERVVKERIAYVYAVEDATVYVLNKAL